MFPAEPGVVAKPPFPAGLGDRRYWAQTSDLCLVDSTWGASYVGLCGRNLVFMRVSGPHGPWRCVVHHRLREVCGKDVGSGMSPCSARSRQADGRDREADALAASASDAAPRAYPGQRSSSRKTRPSPPSLRPVWARPNLTPPVDQPGRTAAAIFCEAGYPIEQTTGKNGKYSEIAGVPEQLRDAFSGHSREVALRSRQANAAQRPSRTQPTGT